MRQDTLRGTPRSHNLILHGHSIQPVLFVSKKTGMTHKGRPLQVISFGSKKWPLSTPKIKHHREKVL
eukprot:5288368-Amphidinium_carterae.1